MPNKTPLAKLIQDKALLRKLDGISKRAFKRVQKKVVTAGAAPIRKAIRSEMPVETGAAKKSIAIKSLKGGAAVIGADADYEGDDGRIPANYIHLIEYGHANSDGSTTPGKHPIERGAKKAESESAARMQSKAETEVNKEIARAK